MAAIGGSVESITIGGREFPVTADADIQRKIGGFESSVEANGNSTGRVIKTRVMGMLSGMVVEVDDSRGDHEFLQNVSDNGNGEPCAITLASGVVWQGQMTITGELQYSTQNTTASFDLTAVDGILTQQ